MIEYVKSTAFIFSWCTAHCFLWAYLCYMFKNLSKKFKIPIYIPALIIAPILIVMGMTFGNVNFIFPSHLLTPKRELFLLSIVPGLVLAVTSGLLFKIAQTVQEQLSFWQTKPFVLFARATGRNVDKELRKLVIHTALLDSFHSCLPFLFGEMLIVEVMFNVPGIGNDLWHLARQRQMEPVVGYLLFIFSVYGLCISLLIHIKKKIGKRLESYG